jgi:Terminase large subunit, T4likevirus-type, N-terminal
MEEQQKEILFQPSEKQLEFMEKVFNGQYTYLLFGGSIRGGKSYCGFACLLLLCQMYPGSRWAIVRASMTRITQNILPSLTKIIPKAMLKSYNANTCTFTMHNGSQVILFSENFDEDKLLLRWRGLEVNGFFADEANELQESSFYKMIERSGSFILPHNAKQPKPLIILTCNPANNWVKKLFYDRWKNNTLPDRWFYLPSNVHDNPFNTPEYLESLKQMTKFEYETMVNGNWELQMKTGMEFYKSFEIEKHVKPAVYDSALPIHLSWDENLQPYLTACVFQIVGTEIRQIDELLGRHPHNTVEAVCKMFAVKYKDHKSGLFIYGDSTSQKADTKLEKGHNFFSLITGYLDHFKPRLRVSKSNPSVSMRGNFINAVFEKEMFGIRFIIDPSCKESIADFINTKESEDGGKVKNMITDSITKSRFQEHGHTSDSFDYMITYAFFSQFCDYQNGGRSGGVTWGNNAPSRNQYDAPQTRNTFIKRKSRFNYE